MWQFSIAVETQQITV